MTAVMLLMAVQDPPVWRILDKQQVATRLTGEGPEQ